MTSCRFATPNSIPPWSMKGMNWLGLVAGWIVVFSPAALAALATAVPMLWNSDPGFDVAIPTFWAVADVLAIDGADVAPADG